MQFNPSSDHARNGDRVPAAARLTGPALAVSAIFAFEIIDVPSARRDAGGIQSVQRLAIPDNRKRIAA
jgi:hypothetical protein